MQTLAQRNQQLAQYLQQTQRNAESPASATADDHEPRPPGFSNVHPVCRGPASSTTDVYGGSQMNTTFSFSQIPDSHTQQQWMNPGNGNESVSIQMLRPDQVASNSCQPSSSNQPQFSSIQPYQLAQRDTHTTSGQQSGTTESIIPVLHNQSI